MTENHPSGRVVVIIPTYNEIDALPDTLARLRAAVPDADVLVVDDGSPDGTGDWVEEQAASDSAIHLMRRTGKQGLGTAYLAGFRWGLDRGYDVLVEMDADGSHRPEQLLAQAPLRTSITPAAHLGPWLSWLFCGAAVVFLIAGFAGASRVRREDRVRD